MRFSLRVTTGVIALSLLTLTGCSAAKTASAPTDSAEAATAISHVHAIVADPAGEGFLLGTHEGIYAVDATGALGGRVGSADFDAMGLTTTEGTLLASGHPGANTPAEWGAPHLGIIRSKDGAASWEPVTFTGQKDFHAMTSGPDGTVFALATDSPELLSSTDNGDTWSSTGATTDAVAFAVDWEGRVIAATPEGTQLSTDGGASFSPWADAPAVYRVAASPDHELVMGVDTDNTIWVTSAAGAWTEAGAVQGSAQAVAITNTGDIVLVDERGLSYLPASN